MQKMALSEENKKEGKAKAMLIINPVSGTRSKEGLGKTVAKALGKKGIETEIRLTTAAGDASKFAREAVEKGYDSVIAAGGDGTVNEIAGALCHTDTTLGIVPLGSGNGLARTLGIPQDVDEALKIICRHHSIKCDRGIVNGKDPFYCTFGVGLDAAVSETFASMRHRGRTTYILSIIREFVRYKSQPYALQINGKVITEKALLIAVCNASQYGNNAYIAPKAKLSDGLLDVTVIHSGSPLSSMLVGVDLMTGFLDRNTSIETFQVSGVAISRLTDGPVHLDGEPRIMGKTMKVNCDERALNVFAPEKDETFRPIISPLRALVNDMRNDLKAMFLNR